MPGSTAVGLRAATSTAARTSACPALSHWNPRSHRNPSITSVPTRPPTRAERSRTRTCRPDSSNARAQASPATPAPITATSVASIGGEYRSVREPAHAGQSGDATWYGPHGPQGHGNGATAQISARQNSTMCSSRGLAPPGSAAAGRRGSVRARRRTPATSPRRRLVRRARRTRAATGRGCRRTSAPVAARSGRRVPGSPAGRRAARDPRSRPRTRRRSTGARRRATGRARRPRAVPGAEPVRSTHGASSTQAVGLGAAAVTQRLGDGERVAATGGVAGQHHALRVTRRRPRRPAAPSPRRSPRR